MRITAKQLASIAGCLGRNGPEQFHDAVTNKDDFRVRIGRLIQENEDPEMQAELVSLRDMVCRLNDEEFGRLMDLSDEWSSDRVSERATLSAEDFIMLATMNREASNEKKTDLFLGSDPMDQYKVLTDADFQALKKLADSKDRRFIENRFGVRLSGPWPEQSLRKFDCYLELAEKRLRQFARGHGITLYPHYPFEGQTFHYTFDTDGPDIRLTPFKGPAAPFAAYHRGTGKIYIPESAFEKKEGSSYLAVIDTDPLKGKLGYFSITDYFVHALVHETGHVLMKMRKKDRQVGPVIAQFGIEKFYEGVPVKRARGGEEEGVVIMFGGAYYKVEPLFGILTELDPINSFHPQEGFQVKKVGNPFRGGNDLFGKMTALTDQFVKVSFQNRSYSQGWDIRDAKPKIEWEFLVDIPAALVTLEDRARKRTEGDDYQRGIRVFRFIWGK